MKLYNFSRIYPPSNSRAHGASTHNHVCFIFADGCKQHHPAFSNVTHMKTVEEIVMNVKNESIMEDFFSYTTKQTDTSGGVRERGIIFLNIILMYDLIF